MKQKLLLLIVAAAVLIIAFAIYRSRASNKLDVEPHAAEEIEKAKRR